MVMSRIKEVKSNDEDLKIFNALIQSQKTLLTRLHKTNIEIEKLDSELHPIGRDIKKG